MESTTETRENIPYVLDDTVSDLAVFERRKAQLLAELAAVGKTPTPDYTALFNASGRLNGELKSIIKAWHSRMVLCFSILQDRYKGSPAMAMSRESAYIEYTRRMADSQNTMQAEYAAALTAYRLVAARFPEPK